MLYYERVIKNQNENNKHVKLNTVEITNENKIKINQTIRIMKLNKSLYTKLKRNNTRH